MARSSYIYIVIPAPSPKALPSAAFTVKHEMEAYLKEKNFKRLYAVFRYPDGPGDIADITHEYVKQEDK